MFIHSQDVQNRKCVREIMEQYPADAEVWQADSGALLVGEEPDTDDWRLIGTVAEYLLLNEALVKSSATEKNTMITAQDLYNWREDYEVVSGVDLHALFSYIMPDGEPSPPGCAIIDLDSIRDVAQGRSLRYGGSAADAAIAVLRFLGIAEEA